MGEVTEEQLEEIEALFVQNARPGSAAPATRPTPRGEKVQQGKARDAVLADEWLRPADLTEP